MIKWSIVQMKIRYSAASVVHDLKKAATPWFNDYSPVRYYPFHGPTGDYRGTFSVDF